MMFDKANSQSNKHRETRFFTLSKILHQHDTVTLRTTGLKNCPLPRNGTYPFPSLGHRAVGGTDVKVTSAQLAGSLEFLAQSGPTWGPLPPFRWSEQDFKDTIPHVGHPDLWQFPLVTNLWA